MKKLTVCLQILAAYGCMTQAMYLNKKSSYVCVCEK